MKFLTQTGNNRYEVTFAIVKPTQGANRGRWLVSVFFQGSPADTLGPYDGDMSPGQVLLNVATRVVLEQSDS